MPYSVDFDDNAGYVTIVLSGKVSVDDLEAARSDASAVLREQGCLNLLVDATAEESDRQVFDDYEFTSKMADHFPKGTRHAAVVNATEREYMQFVENVAQNRGVELNVFIDRQAALDWLLEE